MSYVLTPSTIEQAVEMLTAHPGARPMSGGASLVAMKNARLIDASQDQVGVAATVVAAVDAWLAPEPAQE